MIHVDAVELQHRKAIIEGEKYQNKNSEIDIIAEGAQDNALIVPGKTSNINKIWNFFMRLLTMDTLINQMFSFQKSLY